MKRARLVFAALLVANPLLAQTRAPVEGVWRIVEWVEAGRTYTTVQPSLFVFTKSHYSMAFLQTFQPRPPVAPPQVRQNLTDAEKIARFEDWRPFSASSGTYQVRDSTIELRAIIAKSRWEMGEQAVQSVTFRVEVPIPSAWLSHRHWEFGSSWCGSSSAEVARQLDSGAAP